MPAQVMSAHAIKKIRPLALVLTPLCLAFASGNVGTVMAAVPSAGWSVGSAAEPTNFSASETQDAVQVFAVHATGGTYELSVNGGENPEELSTEVNWNESAAGLQVKLENVADIGIGNVEVSGGVGDESGSMPYSIRYVGALSGRGKFLLLRKNLLTGGTNTITQESAMSVKAFARDRYTVTATNTGSQPTTGITTIADNVPSQLAVVSAKVEERPSRQSNECTISPSVVCEYGEPVALGAKLVVTIVVASKSPSLTGAVVNKAAVSGGGAAASVGVSESTPMNTGAASFEIEQFAFEANGIDGQPDMQAGDHPYGVTTTINLSTVMLGGEAGIAPYVASQEVKDVSVELPLGLVGDPLATERCPEVDMTIQTGGTESGITACPSQSIVGEIWLRAEGSQWSFGPYPIYNVIPERGYPAELAFNAAGFGQPIFLFASVVPGQTGYKMRVATPGALRTINFDVEGIALTIFGDPSSHNGGSGGHMAFVTNPTACSNEPVGSRLEVVSWEGKTDSRETVAYPQVSGCDLLQGASAFSPVVHVLPEQTQTDIPSGYEVDLKVPQAPNVFGQPAAPELRDASATFPAGLSLSPAAASGPNSLEGCTPAQIDLLGTEVGKGGASPYDDGMTHASPGHCPAKSQVGDVEIKTPLLEDPLRGHVYVAAPSCGGVTQPPCTAESGSNGELFGIYLELAGSGVIVKLHGKVTADPITGQLTTSFTENPQLPFEELKLTFYGGQRAALANPQTCGSAVTKTELVPWSAPESGPNATPTSVFEVTGCTNPMPFAPAFSAGTTQTLGGAFSPFTLSLTRKDGEQDFGGIAVTLPPGLSGMTSKVTRCNEIDANAGICPESSRIGTAHAAAGSGSQPLWLEGPVYFTGPYHGAPFGLSVVIPTKAGPFNLGNEVVRSAITVNPRTAQATTTTEPLRLIRDGVPFRLKAIDVTIDRPEFIFNPTNCSQQQLTGSIAGDMPEGSPGSAVAVSTPFAVTGCKNLPFHPSFRVSTDSTTSKTNGASLDVKVKSASGSANIHEVHVSLPKQLPSRLDTLKLACIDTVFEANPAACPSASAVGMATAVTPIFAHILAGPAYLVSHGGAEFPDLEIVLQAEGVTLLLDGKTDIKKNITISTFSTVPDAPVSSFELRLPAGAHSVLGAPGGKLCTASLVMPTIMHGQNGALVEQKTKVAVTGCKPAINVLRHSVRGSTATITARTPAAGVLVAEAPGLSRAVKRLGKAGSVTLKLTLTRAERKFLTLHPGRRLREHIELRFTPRHGHGLSTGVTVLIG
ncbi:MAG: hypothetical protein ACRDJ3_00680 [Solirubrobacteraceae bacterium]